MRESITFGRLTPDLLIKAKPKNRAFFLHGCFMKGHGRENCKIFPEDLCQLEKKIFGLDYAERRASCQAKMNLVPTDIEVTELWECELKFNQSYQHFVQYEFKEKPLTRLRPEDALSGGINEIIQLHWTVNKKPDEKFVAYDVNSLYNSIAIDTKFPVGKPQIITESEDIHIENNRFLYGSERLIGLVFCRLVARRESKLAYILIQLGHQHHWVLCYACLRQEKKDVCKHRTKARSFRGTFYVAQVEYALDMGYQVLDVFEALHYQRQEYLERPFLLLIAKNKIEFTLANKLVSKTEILDMENEMNLDIPVLKLRTSSNELLQGFYKSAPNDIFGKFMAKPGPNTSIVHFNAEICDVFFSKARKLKDVNPITEHICEVTTECITDWSFLGGNLMAGMAIVLEAQMFMLQKMTTLMQRNVNVLGIATDCLFLSYPRTLDPPVEVSLTLDKFKDAYPCHEKDYCIQFMDGQMVVKRSGFNLTAPASRESFMTQFASIKAAILEHRRSCLKIGQFRLRKLENYHWL